MLKIWCSFPLIFGLHQKGKNFRTFSGKPTIINQDIEAIRKSGLERDAIIESVKEMRYEGVTGTIEFDANGNRKGKPGFLKIKSGVPVAVERNN